MKFSNKTLWFILVALTLWLPCSVLAKDKPCVYLIWKTVGNGRFPNFHDTDRGVRATIYNLVIPPVGHKRSQILYAKTTSSYTCRQKYRINISTTDTVKNGKCYVSEPINVQNAVNGIYRVFLLFPKDFTYGKCCVK